MIDKNGKIKNAGNVLFGKSPNGDLRCAIFATEEKSTFLDMQDYSGNIFKLIDIGEQYISKNIRWSANFNTGFCKRRCSRNSNDSYKRSIMQCLWTSFLGGAI